MTSPAPQYCDGKRDAQLLNSWNSAALTLHLFRLVTARFSHLPKTALHPTLTQVQFSLGYRARQGYFPLFQAGEANCRFFSFGSSSLLLVFGTYGLLALA